jgi:hypothetical protein
MTALVLLILLVLCLAGRHPAQRYPWWIAWRSRTEARLPITPKRRAVS